MFLKARQWIRMMLLALLVQFGNLGKIGPRKRYGDKQGNHRQIRQVGNDFTQGAKSRENGPSMLSLDDPAENQLSLTGKLEPRSHLPTLNLLGNSYRGYPEIASSRSDGSVVCRC